MKRLPIKLALVTTYISFLTLTPASASPQMFSAEQEERIGQVAADYLVAHPEVLVSVSQRLQQQQEREQLRFAVSVMENQTALLSDPDTPTVGPKEAKVAIIEFFDYQCTFCIAMAPELDKVMKSNPDVRYVFKEWPIFAGSRENSQLAAERGLAVWKAKGAEAYVTYHNAVFAAGRAEGKVTKADIDQAAEKASWHENGKDDFKDALTRTDELARKMSLSGTPVIIVMPVAGALPKNITVFPGKVSSEMLETAIRKAASQR